MYEEPRASRLLDCPDGIGRFIRLTTWHWYSLDWMIEHFHLSLEDIVRSTWDIAMNDKTRTDHIDKKFEIHMDYAIFFRMLRYFPWINGFTNDNKMVIPDTKKIFGKIIQPRPAEDEWRISRLYHASGTLIFHQTPGFYIFSMITPWGWMTDTANDNKLTVIPNV